MIGIRLKETILPLLMIIFLSSVCCGQGYKKKSSRFSYLELNGGVAYIDLNTDDKFFFLAFPFYGEGPISQRIILFSISKLV